MGSSSSSKITKLNNKKFIDECVIVTNQKDYNKDIANTENNAPIQYKRDGNNNQILEENKANNIYGNLGVKKEIYNLYTIDTLVRPSKKQNESQKSNDNLTLKSIVNSKNDDDLIIESQLKDILRQYIKIKNAYANKNNFNINNYGETLKSIRNKLNFDFGLSEKIEFDYENMRNRLQKLNYVTDNERTKISGMDYYQFISNVSQNSLFYKNIIETNKSDFEI